MDESLTVDSATNSAEAGAASAASVSATAVLGEVRVDPARYPKYITGTDRCSDCNPDFLHDKPSLTSEVPCFCSNFSTMLTSQSHLSNQTTCE
jgi:hypothetical protein